MAQCSAGGTTYPSSGRACALALVVLGATIGCSLAEPRLHAPDQLPSPEGAGTLKAHLLSGDLVVFHTWTEDIETRRLVGTGRRYDRDRNGASDVERIELPVDSVALLETSRDASDPGHSLGLTLLGSYTLLAGTVSLICLANPKSCFGSCPTFYLDGEGEEERLAAEGFSSSVARALEATDLDDLRVREKGGAFSIRMRNEALETHAVRSLHLHAVAEPNERRVLATPGGTFHAAERMLEPTRCSAPEGDCLEAVRALDGNERKSLTDSTDLAAREIIELDFPFPARSHGEPLPRLGLAVAARHSFVSTFLFYQMLAYLGRDAGAFIATLERGDERMLERVREVLELPGRLEVEVAGPDGTWHPAGALVEAGPLATDLQLLELPEVASDGPIRVRLDLTRGFWRLEHAALVEMGEAVESILLPPVAVEGLDDAAPDADEALAALLAPDRYLVTEPGAHFRITFDLPEGPEAAGEGPTYRLFLQSTGYYYEWMRSEWLEEESPRRAAMMFLQPRQAFRELAPVFKKLESEMEEAFWASRFRR